SIPAITAPLTTVNVQAVASSSAVRVPDPIPSTIAGSFAGSMAGSVAGSHMGSIAGSVAGMSPYAGGTGSPYAFDFNADLNQLHFGLGSQTQDTAVFDQHMSDDVPA
ncbi:hypothetical protein B0H10DRAFT_2231614, partial [Mycena sp. CBHHK59/15]